MLQLLEVTGFDVRFNVKSFMLMVFNKLSKENGDEKMLNTL